MHAGAARRRALLLCCLSVAVCADALAQSTQNEIRPELRIYRQQGEILRFELDASATGDQSAHQWQGNITLFVQAAMRPVFRRQLRERPDTFRNKYLTFGVGYRRRNTLTEGNSTAENRILLDLTSRYRLPWQLLISDRNRGEFRFIQGQPFSTRYRNRLRLERDFKSGWLDITPYVYDEIYYDTRYDRWTPNNYAFGVEFPIGPHVVLEPYYLRQGRRASPPPHLNAFGFRLSLYF
jgi:hypothetical protein